jgi:hypothetical protein
MLLYCWHSTNLDRTTCLLVASLEHLAKWTSPRFLSYAVNRRIVLFSISLKLLLTLIEYCQKEGIHDLYDCTYLHSGGRKLRALYFITVEEHRSQTVSLVEALFNSILIQTQGCEGRTGTVACGAKWHSPVERFMPIDRNKAN